MKNLKELVSIKSKRFWEAPFGPIWALPRPPPLCQTGKRGEKSAPKHPGKPLHPPPFVQCPYWNNTFQKGASLSRARTLWADEVVQIGWMGRGRKFGKPQKKSSFFSQETILESELAIMSKSESEWTRERARLRQRELCSGSQVPCC